MRDAFKAHAAGQMSDAAYREVEDRNIVEAIRMQEETGLETISDGEFRRGSWAFGLVKAVEGFGEARSMFEFHDAAGNSYPFDTCYAVAKIRRTRPIAVGEFEFVRHHTRRVAKVTMPAPSFMHFFRGQACADPAVYPDLGGFWADLLRVYHEELAELGRAGRNICRSTRCRSRCCAIPPCASARARSARTPTRWSRCTSRAINDALSARPPGMTVGMHLCRGNLRSRWMADGQLRGGGRAHVQRTNVDAFFLEYDSPRAGDFAPLRFMPKDKTVVLGLVSTKTPVLEDADALRRRIDEAARQVPLERLGAQPAMRFRQYRRRQSAFDRRRAAQTGAGGRSRKARVGLAKKRETSKPEGETLMAYENFVVERAGAIATVYFNRPEKLNPISGKLLSEMLEVAAEFRDDEESRVVILTGKGRSFCAGADIGGLTANAGAQAQRAQTDAGRIRAARTGWRLMEEWERLDQVTIAAVNGFAIGGGLSLAMACDFRIAAAGARIWIPEVALGVPYMWGSITRLINLVGMSKAKEMIMTCDEVSAQDALKIGLVNQVVPAERLAAAALEFAGKLVSKPPMALRRTKDFFKALGNGRLGDITYADGYLGLSCLASDDMGEAMAAFKEKRPGRYRGR